MAKGTTRAAVEHRARRDRLIEEYQHFTQQVAGKLVKSMGLPASMQEEFASAGYLGLVEAAERFDHSSGADFKTFAYLRIRGAIIDSIRENSDLSGRGYRYARALQAAQSMREELHNERQVVSSDLSHQRAPSSVVIRSKEAHLGRILQFASRSVLAFRLSVHDAEDEISTGEGAERTPEQRLADKREAGLLQELVKTLPDRERIIVEEYYFLGRSFAEIVDAHEGFSKSWVSRLHSRALEKIKSEYVKRIAETRGER